MYKLVGDSGGLKQGRSNVDDSTKSQINGLLENEIQYKRQIRALEKESQEVARTYETVQNENRNLRNQLEHGIDANRMKKLTKENGKLKKQTSEQSKEIENLRRKVAELEKEIGEEKSDVIEQEWRSIVLKGKQEVEKREAELRAGRRGNFERKKKREILDEIETKDGVDLKIDTLEKKTIILLNKIQKLASEKYQVKFATALDKGNITKNPVLSNAINQKLNKDLQKFEDQLEKLTNKHQTLKSLKEEVSRHRQRHKEKQGSPSPVVKSSPTLDRRESSKPVASPVLSNTHSPTLVAEKKWDARRQRFNMTSPNLMGTNRNNLGVPLKSTVSEPTTLRRTNGVTEKTKDAHGTKETVARQGRRLTIPQKPRVEQTTSAEYKLKENKSLTENTKVRKVPARTAVLDDYDSMVYDNYYDKSKPRVYSPGNSKWSPTPIRFREHGTRH